ncbi:acyl-CoA dehydrogenase family protein [Zafaria sp. Z1313]|uniref:acyl-CoA dehydrogenase family protein n=1 Tax=unclassified Zafaria TaxID=2828765 RepID=UPI002E7654BB|nr:acyl-CoA dehydrogenase family protein [Zafaria sp. J156]MEE1621223.1 acyl-CoA dehydrogenase family protein [Zafaria sp. J156]
MADVSQVLDASLLERIRGRAAGYDAGNRFCAEDLRELQEAGYLKAMLPERLGGRDWGLETTAAAQRLLAAHAPATALAVNMHLVWTGIARLLAARGDHRLDAVGEWAAAGEVLAFGISEAGNDSVLFDSTTVAEEVRDEGGDAVYFTGTKIFTSLSPAWTRLGVFGRLEREGAEPELLHGFVERDDPGVSIVPTWDALGMRATQSHTTRLDRARVPVEGIHSRLPAAPNDDPLVFGIFASFLTLVSAVYAGIADRGMQLAAELPAARTSNAAGGRGLDQDPDVRWQVADAGLAVLALDPQLRLTARELDDGVDHGAQWFPRLVALRTHATETARRTVDLALRVAGGRGYFRGGELERLYRDVLAGLYHPSDAGSAHRTVAAWLLGPVEPAG